MMAKRWRGCVHETYHRTTGKRHGPRVEISYYGKPEMRESYYQGRKSGWTMEYYSQKNTIKQKSYYLNGKKHGLEQQYYQNCRLVRREHYLPGQDKYYYQIGQLARQAYYHAGRKHGPYREWRISGRLRAECSYQFGKRCSAFKRYPKY